MGRGESGPALSHCRLHGRKHDGPDYGSHARSLPYRDAVCRCVVLGPRADGDRPRDHRLVFCASAASSRAPAAPTHSARRAGSRLDRLLGIKQDLLSVSHQLAELQDIMGRPITGQRLRDGTNIG